MQDEFQSAAPFYEETTRIFHLMNVGRFEELNHLVDVHCSAVVPTSEKSSQTCYLRDEWHRFLFEQIKTIDESEAPSDIKFIDYRAEDSDTMGWSLVHFYRAYTKGGQVRRKYYAATLLWKLFQDGWRAFHVHVSPDHIEKDDMAGTSDTRTKIFEF